MALCKYCKQPAGFLRWQHKACRAQHDAAATRIPEFFAKALHSTMEPARFRQLAQEIAHTHYVNDVEFRSLSIRGLKAMIDEAFTNARLTEEEDASIVKLCSEFNITADQLGPSGIKFAKAEILLRLNEGKLPTGLTINNMPIILAPEERAIWLFNNVTYYTNRTRTQYVGRSQGVSVRLMKGIYYRVGSFHGTPIKSEYLSEEGQGIFVIASKNVYFWSPKKAVKMPSHKIISAEPYSDGVEIMRDGANAKPLFFTLNDPLFAVDVIARLNHL